MTPTVRQGLALGLLIAATSGPAAAQDGRSVVFMAGGGTVCVDGNAAMWGDKDGRIKLWRRPTTERPATSRSRLLLLPLEAGESSAA